MDRLETLKLFVRVAELGNFSQVAREVRISQPQVSRAIRDLERDLGVQLLQRTTRRVVLTREGERYLHRLREALIWLEVAAEEARSTRGQPVGTLRLTAPIGFGQYRVAPAVLSYLDSFPQAEVTLQLTDRFVDLVEENFDLAIRIGAVESSSLRLQNLGDCPTFLVATPDYLREQTPLKYPQDLNHHECIAYLALRSPREWVLWTQEGQTCTVAVQGRYRSNHLPTIRDAVLSGFGIANLPEWLIEPDLKAGSLVRVLPGWFMEQLPVQAILPPGEHSPARTRQFLGHLQPWISQVTLDR